jgi:hypothetical protein
MRAAGRVVEQVTLSAGQTTFPMDAEEAAGWNERTVLIVDGYEQLAWTSRLWLQGMLAARGAGTLITTHETMGFPTIWKSDLSADLAWRVVSAILAEGPPSAITPALVEKLLGHHAGNMREVLFALYDVYQQD